ncbi:UNKNOWN [Stylonychia lemnae]|uniref:TRP C-terminal domain-containing protein n=1 Tax=Stylonychia lemnae TaxID=5949 RepID=A0A078ALG7_STYLE|nr:UNKNOWN [Stylonychia lemnae]|eukprot:CDW83064.1 UNKNOWN [Stylonychia lemnae]
MRHFVRPTSNIAYLMTFNSYFQIQKVGQSQQHLIPLKRQGVTKLYSSYSASYTFPFINGGSNYDTPVIQALDLPHFMAFSQTTKTLTINTTNIDYSEMDSVIGEYQVKFYLNTNEIASAQEYYPNLNIVNNFNKNINVKVIILDQSPSIYPQVESGDEVLYLNFTEPYLLGNTRTLSRMPTNYQLSIPIVSQLTKTQIVQEAGTAVTSSTSTVMGISTLLQILQQNSQINLNRGASLAFLWSLINAVQLYEFMPLAQVNTPLFVHDMIGRFTISRFDFIPKSTFFDLYFNTKYSYDLKLFGIETYLPVYFSCLITIKGALTMNNFEIVSLVFAIIFWIIYTGFLIFSWIFLTTKYKDLPKHSPKYQYYKSRYNSYYSEIKMTSLANILYYPAFLTHRTIIAYMLVFVTYSFYAQLSIFLVSQLSMLLYLIIFRPFRLAINNFIEIFNESCVLISIPFLFLIQYYQNDGDQVLIFGWGFTSILILNVGINVINAFYQSINKQVILICRKYGKCFKINGKVNPFVKYFQQQTERGGLNDGLETQERNKKQIHFIIPSDLEDSTKQQFESTTQILKSQQDKPEKKNYKNNSLEKSFGKDGKGINKQQVQTYSTMIRYDKNDKLKVIVQDSQELEINSNQHRYREQNPTGQSLNNSLKKSLDPMILNKVSVLSNADQSNLNSSRSSRYGRDRLYSFQQQYRQEQAELTSQRSVKKSPSQKKKVNN